MDIKTLTLTDKRSTVSSEVKNLLLADFPNCFINGFDIGRDVGDVLDRTIVRDNHVLHIVIPKVKSDKFAEKPRAHNLELASEYSTSVDVTLRN